VSNRDSESPGVAVDSCNRIALAGSPARANSMAAVSDQRDGAFWSEGSAGALELGAPAFPSGP